MASRCACRPPRPRPLRGEASIAADTIRHVDLNLGNAGGTLWWVNVSRTGGLSVGLKPFAARAQLVVGVDAGLAGPGTGAASATIQAEDSLTGTQGWGLITLVDWLRLDLNRPGHLEAGPWPVPETADLSVVLRATFRSYGVAQIGNVGCMFSDAETREAKT